MWCPRSYLGQHKYFILNRLTRNTIPEGITCSVQILPLGHDRATTILQKCISIKKKKPDIEATRPTFLTPPHSLCPKLPTFEHRCLRAGQTQRWRWQLRPWAVTNTCSLLHTKESTVPAASVMLSQNPPWAAHKKGTMQTWDFIPSHLVLGHIWHYSQCRGLPGTAACRLSRPPWLALFWAQRAAETVVNEDPGAEDAPSSRSHHL